VVTTVADQPQPSERGERSVIRFEATVHPGEAGVLDVSRVSDLDLDRVPDPGGLVRLLIDPEECVGLLEQGFEVHLHRAVTRQPLDPQLVTDDAQVRAFEERIRAAGEAESS
jgi:hypothetical protein